MAGLLMALVLSACVQTTSGGQGTATESSAQSAGGPQQVQVVEKDYSIALSTSVVQPGQVEFDLSNQGPSEHEFVIFKTDLAPDQLPTKNAIVDESSSDLTKVFEQNQYPADTSKTVDVNLDAGNYVVICNLPGHYQQGMRAALTVTADAAPTQTAMAGASGQASPTPTPTAEATAGQTQEQAQGEGTNVGVILKNFDIFVDRDSVPAGTVTFNLRNEGITQHEFVIFKTDLSAADLPVNDAQVQEGAASLQKITEQQEFAPNETRQLTLQLDPGHYVLICNLPDHYQQGMHIDFSVVSTSAESTGNQPTATPETSTSTAQSTSQVSVIEQNYGIYLNQAIVPAGQVEFDLSNLGPDQHEFVIFKTDLAPDNLPVQNGQVVETASSLQKIDEQQEYPSGGTRTLAVSLDPGNYVLICNIVGHYQQGMHVGFTVIGDSGQVGDARPSPESTNSVSVVEQNYGIYLDTTAVPAGQVEFDLSNLGPDQHEFVVFKTDLAAGALPVDNGQVNENASALQKMDEQQEYPSGESRTLTLNLDPGHYVLICNLPGHYQQGMHVDFTVVDATASNTSSGQDQTSQAPTINLVPGQVSILEENFRIFSNRSIIPAGQIQFNLANSGPDAHEFVVFKTELAADQLPVQDGQVMESDPALEKIGEQEQFDPGETRTITFDLAPGHYVLICNLPGHYEEGMHFGLTVTAAHERVQVTEENYAILLDRGSVSAGTVDFILNNLGPDQHEFVVFKTDLAPYQLPVENGQVVEDAPSLVKMGEHEQYPAGESRVLTLDLDAGHYVLICNLPGHFEQGMVYELTVLSN
jgi:uncharacterized cupredoxin-like copper-binding protein